MTNSVDVVHRGRSPPNGSKLPPPFVVGRWNHGAKGVDGVGTPEYLSVGPHTIVLVVDTFEDKGIIYTDRSLARNTESSHTEMVFTSILPKNGPLSWRAKNERTNERRTRP